MQSQKKYSNATFTKRVDHEAGRHRPAHLHHEPAKCSTCGAVYMKRRWVAPDMAHKSSKARIERPVEFITCPACAQIQKGSPAGFLYVDGAFFTKHQEEIERLLNNEADRAAEDNPLARIMTQTIDESGRLVVTTTTEHLAATLGRALQSAFSGELRFNFSHENKVSRVYWHRD
jgi:NMD protein affecting ribosome stability and mRNA decay